MDKPRGSSPATVVGRYSIHAEIAHGGMATVHLGRLMGPVGFSRTVAVKRLHSIFARDPEFVAMFMDEARLAARVQHPNVVSIIDVVADSGELLLVMDYVQGESLSRLLRAQRNQGSFLEQRIAVKILTELLSGLHAAHEARNERGIPLGIVHRDVSPQNVLVGVDGVAHLIDFGVAKAAGRVQNTRDGQLKGKLAYMAPEQIRNTGVDRRTDVYAAAAVLWEALTGRRLFTGDEANLMYAVLTVPIAAPSTVNPSVSPQLDAVVMKGLQKNPAKRYATALEMADALEAATALASSREVAKWMELLAAKELGERACLVAEVEGLSHVSSPPGPMPMDVPSEERQSQSASDIGIASPVDIVTDTSSSISSANINVRSPVRPLWVALGVGAALVVGTLSFLIGRAAMSGAVPTASAPRPEPAASAVPAQSEAAANSSAPAAEVVPVPSAAKVSESVPHASNTPRLPAAPVAQPAVPPTPVLPSTGKKKKYTRD